MPRPLSRFLTQQTPAGVAVCILLFAVLASSRAGWSQLSFDPAAPQLATTSTAIALTDYFNDGNDAGWTQINRAWHVRKGRYVLDGGYLPDAQGRAGFSVTHVDDFQWRDYRIEATFDDENPARLPSPDVHEATFFFRVQSAPPYGTFYAVSIWGPNVGDPRGSGRILPRGLVQLARCVKPPSDTMQCDSLFTEDSNSVNGTNYIEISAYHRWIRVWVNGKKVIQTVDANPLMWGGIGLGAVWEAQAWFDNVKVTLVQ